MPRFAFLAPNKAPCGQGPAKTGKPRLVFKPPLSRTERRESLSGFRCPRFADGEGERRSGRAASVIRGRGLLDASGPNGRPTITRQAGDARRAIYFLDRRFAGMDRKQRCHRVCFP
jgi:hypothetical protein